MHRLTPLLLFLSLLLVRPACAAEAGDFASWLHAMRQEAQAQGITSEEAGYRFHAFRFAGGFVETVTGWAEARAAE